MFQLNVWASLCWMMHVCFTFICPVSPSSGEATCFHSAHLFSYRNSHSCPSVCPSPGLGSNQDQTRVFNPAGCKSSWVQVNRKESQSKIPLSGSSSYYFLCVYVLFGLLWFTDNIQICFCKRQHVRERLIPSLSLLFSQLLILNSSHIPKPSHSAQVNIYIMTVMVETQSEIMSLSLALPFTAENSIRWMRMFTHI